MVNFKKLFTQKRSPFTSASASANEPNMQENPHAYGRRSEYNQSSPLNRAKKISHTYEVGEKVGIREIPLYIGSNNLSLLQNIKEGIISEIIPMPYNNTEPPNYMVRFDTSAGPKELPMYPDMLKKIRQDGGAKRRRHRSRRRRTIRR